MIENELNSDYLAHIDPLTRLLNRRGFEARADDVLTLCNHAGLSACLFLFDLVDFKDFNEQHGPAAGDRMLIEFCRHMKDTFRGSDLIARYGDDDFIVLMVDVADQQPDAALQRFRNAMQGVSRAANQPYRAGWTLLQSGDDIQHLVLRASENMHQCTDSGNR